MLRGSEYAKCQKGKPSGRGHRLRLARSIIILILDGAEEERRISFCDGTEPSVGNGHAMRHDDVPIAVLARL